MMEYTVASTKEGLFNCFRKHNVEFGLDYCLWKFDIKEATKDIPEGDPNRDQLIKLAKDKIMDCFGRKNVPQGAEYCEIMFDGNLKEKIACYEKHNIKSLSLCEEKKIANE